jgi:hypothetical protein
MRRRKVIAMYTAKVPIAHQRTIQGGGVVILEPWYAAHFRTHTLGDRLPHSFGILFHWDTTMFWQAFWDGECGFYCLLGFKRVTRCDGF